MEFVRAVDYGDAPDCYVSGIARVTKIGKNVLRISFFVLRENDDGSVEHRIVSAQVWTDDALCELYSALRAIIEAMRTGQLAEAPATRTRDMH